MVDIILNCSVSTFPGCETRYTNFDSDGGGWLAYLDRHRLACNAGEAMKSFRLERDGSGSRYRYVYSCCKLAALAGGRMSAQSMNNANLVEYPNGWYAGYLNQVPISCDNPGSFLQAFNLGITYTDRRLWRNCVGWHPDVVDTRHNDWCAGDVGAGWTHDLTGAQDNCNWGWGKGWCVYPPRFRYYWVCLAQNAAAKYERRACQEYRTPTNEFRTTVWLDRHFVSCPGDTLLTSVKWIVESGGGNSGWGFYSFRCCNYN